MNFAHIVVISKGTVMRRKFLDDNFKNGRSAIKNYQAGACPGWSDHNSPNPAVSSG